MESPDYRTIAAPACRVPCAGLVLKQNLSNDEAAREFEKAMEIDPRHLPAQRALDEMRGDQ